ncbi:hypothetical protein IEQ34_000599 [Dendrobium chrysotoxum]|uniref:MADS-box domain-containing protein n=1 Tax=Dendrobium chrysotoxum TaxID=161865 RepID=A0AAV7HPI0_DENCH|nr:hypothetical protein IEQ34_000599 [Dendrobium chrysotoxum]
MGRAKLELIYQENFCTRLRTYTTRMKGLKKKGNELSVLCGVDVLVASFSPELNTLELWPEDTMEFSRIRERFLSFRMKKSCICDHERKGISEQQIPTRSSLSLPSFHEEKAAMEIKLHEVRERLEFLRRQRQEEAERLQAHYMASKALQQLQNLHRRQHPSSFSGCLPLHITADYEIPLQSEPYPDQKLSPFAQFLPLHVQPSPFARDLFPQHDFNIPLQQDFHPQEQASPFSHSLPPHEQPLLVPPHEQPLSVSLSLPHQEQLSPLSKSTPPHPDADFNREDAPTSLLSFDSPLWSNYEYLGWCDSLLLDYQTEL